VKNVEALRRVEEERNTLHSVKQRKAKRIGHMWLMKCLLKHSIEGKIEGAGRRKRRRKQIQNDLKETRVYKQLNEEAPDRTVWRTRFERDHGTVVRRTVE
jgi:hypothetical protein